MNDIDATTAVLIENVSACQAGEVRNGLTVAMESERDSTERVLNVIANFGFRPVLRALSVWCTREPEKCLAAECDRLLRAFDAARHPMLRECADAGADLDDKDDSPPRPGAHPSRSNGAMMRSGAPFEKMPQHAPAQVGTAGFHCPRCGSCDWDLMAGDAGEHGYQTCQGCGYQWVQCC